MFFSLVENYFGFILIDLILIFFFIDILIVYLLIMDENIGLSLGIE